jgi:hypothetical protein
LRRSLCGCGMVVLSSGFVAACGSSNGAAKASSPPASSTCRQVSAVLSDGPDPDADPVGYAFAQIIPLRQIKVVSDQPLQQAIDGLATAYQQFYADDGVGSAAKHAVSQASDRVNALCPGAAS